MKAKDYLKQIELLDVKIKHRKEQVEEMRRKAAGINGSGINPDKVQTSAKGDIMSQTIASYIDLQSDIINLIAELDKQKNEAISRIHRLTNSRYVNLLYKHYVEYKSLDKIANEMNYSYDHIKHMHIDALNIFEKVNRDILEEHTQ